MSKEQITTAIVTAFVTLTITGIGAVLSTWLNFGRYRREKWWEKKVDAYQRIIQALHHASNCYSQWAIHSMNPEREIPESKSKQLDEDYTNAHREIETATGIGAYIISKEVADILTILDKERGIRISKFNHANEALWEAYEADEIAYKNALVKIRDLATKDLQV